MTEENTPPIDEGTDVVEDMVAAIPAFPIATNDMALKTPFGRKRKLSPEQQAEVDKMQAEIDEQMAGIQFETDFNDKETSPIYNYTINVHVDSDHPQANKAVYDKANGVLNIYLHEGYGLTGEPDKDVIAKHILDGNYAISLLQLGILTIADPTALRTCQFFTADRDIAKEYPVTVSSRHEWDRPFSVASCSEPYLLKVRQPPVCDQTHTQAVCEWFKPEVWREEVAYASDDGRYAMESLRKNLGFKYYRVVETKTAKKGKEPEVIVHATSNVVDDGYDAHSSALKALNSIVEDHPDAVPVKTENTVEPQQKYFDYAFS